MHRIHFMAALSLQLMVSFAVCAQHVPQTPYLPGNDAPNWVRLMYGDDASPEVVRSAFEAHYERMSLRQKPRHAILQALDAEP